MIVVDTSALLGIIFRESDWEELSIAVAKADRRVMSTFSYFEASAVLSHRLGSAAIDILDDTLIDPGLELLVFDRVQAELSRNTYCRYGKGHHPAALNLGDCVSYALAKSLGAPLLFKGTDFERTDVPVWRPAR